MKDVACGQVREYLAVEELRLKLDPAQKESVERHLVVCEACRRALLEERELSVLIEEGLEAQAQGTLALAGRIAAALPMRGEGGVRHGRRYLALDVVAALALFGVGLFVGWLLQPGAGNETLPPPGTDAVVVPRYVGNTGTLSQEVLQDDRVRTQDRRRFIFVDPEWPDGVLIWERESVLEDPVTPEGTTREYKVD